MLWKRKAITIGVSRILGLRRNKNSCLWKYQWWKPKTTPAHEYYDTCYYTTILSIQTENQDFFHDKYQEHYQSVYLFVLFQVHIHEVFHVDNVIYLFLKIQLSVWKISNSSNVQRYFNDSSVFVSICRAWSHHVICLFVSVYKCGWYVFQLQQEPNRLFLRFLFVMRQNCDCFCQPWPWHASVQKSTLFVVTRILSVWSVWFCDCYQDYLVATELNLNEINITWTWNYVLLYFR